ncbi:MAG: intein-containing Rv2578c family radical SAM protein [Actinobacteria bacterium]|nr:intein-containing Rv2578c family radical SAM protein [Actinomycetota bacterium]
MASDRLFELRRRTFDTPNFRGIEFIEVESKSIINHVPGNYLPFNYTINPYRGCSHACSYCQGGDTQILLADGRTRRLADLRVGDQIYGTQIQGRYRRYVTTEVLAHWSTWKRAYRVTLDDGADLIASGDHRFLSNRGWKHVTGTECGADQRPHLTLSNRLLGPGGIPEGPKHDSDYQRGYLCGMIRGDGHLSTYRYRSVSGRPYTKSHFRLALVDQEGLSRTRSYLQDRGVDVVEFQFSEATDCRKALYAIRNQRRADVEVIAQVIAWPHAPSLSWCKGFLAGIYDAEGGCSQGVLRISNSDEEIISWILGCMSSLDFKVVVEESQSQRGKAKPVAVIRIRGGLKERLRFFLSVDPAITRKRSFEGAAVKNSPPRRVVSVEDLGVEMPMYDMTTGTGDFIADGVISHNCFARSTHTFLGMDAGKDFETKIVVKVNAAELLHKELRKKSWMGEGIAMGTATDPYQRAEGRYQLMPKIIKELVDVGNPFSILTKGTLLLRDLDLLIQAAKVTDVSTAYSIGTLDEDVWRKSEPGTPHPRKRLDAVARLNAAGIPCGVLMAPVLPGISDSPEQMRAVVEGALDAGATNVSPILLHLRPKVKEVYMGWLEDNYPDLVPRYQAMYRGSAYASRAARQAFGAEVGEIIRDAGGVKRSPDPKPARFSKRSADAAARARKERAELASQQLTLI